MNYQIAISFAVVFLGLASCTKSESEYHPAVASSQSLDVSICYSEGYWGDIERLKITAPDLPSIYKEISFKPSTVSSKGVEHRCVSFHLPYPDYDNIVWNDEKTYGKCTISVRFESPKVDFTIEFGVTYYLSEIKDLLGGSSIVVTSVSSGAATVNRDFSVTSGFFLFDVSDLKLNE